MASGVPHSPELLGSPATKMQALLTFDRSVNGRLHRGQGAGTHAGRRAAVLRFEWGLSSAWGWGLPALACTPTTQL